MKSELVLGLAVFCALWGLKPEPDLPTGSFWLRTQPSGAQVSILQAQTVLPRGGASLRTVGHSPGPLQVSGPDFPAVLVLEMPGYASVQRQVSNLDQLQKMSVQLQPSTWWASPLTFLKSRLWLVPVLLFAGLGLALRRREQRELARQRAMLVRLTQGLVETGDSIAGYKVERLLGAGGMGVVYLARSSEGSAVSLKLLKRRSSAAEERLRKEAEVCFSLRHPGLIYLLDWGQWAGLPYLAYEFVEGQPLDDYLAAHPQDADWVRQLGQRLGQALAYMHEAGVIHRDLKPSNVLIDDQGRPRLMDFGIATFLQGPRDEAVLGTPGYVAPEILRGQAFDAKVDGYALASLLYWAYTGRPAFPGVTNADVMKAQLQGVLPDMAGVPESERPFLQDWLQVDADARGRMVGLPR